MKADGVRSCRASRSMKSNKREKAGRGKERRCWKKVETMRKEERREEVLSSVVKALQSSFFDRAGRCFNVSTHFQSKGDKLFRTMDALS